MNPESKLSTANSLLNLMYPSYHRLPYKPKTKLFHLLNSLKSPPTPILLLENLPNFSLSQN